MTDAVLPCEKQYRGDQSGAGSKILFCRSIVVVVVVSLPEARTVPDAIPRNKFDTVTTFALMARKHSMVEFRQ